MTAIAGVICCDNKSLEKFNFEGLFNYIKVFGKDNQSDIFWSDGYFVRALLSITPEDRFDHQPLIDTDTEQLVLFDGRLDNRSELGELLDINFTELAQLSDSEIALKAVLRWDSLAPSYFIGSFAIACWQPQKKRLWLARDLLGIRPLYWTCKESQIAFSSSAKSLLLFNETVPIIDEKRLYEQLCLLQNDGQESFFIGISRVEPGHVIDFIDGILVSNNPHHSLDNTPLTYFDNDEDYVEELDKILRQIMKDQLRSAYPISTQLSSGFDSTIVTYYASRELEIKNERITAYTAVPRPGYEISLPLGLHSDEFQIASLVAEHLGNVDHIKVDVQEQDWFDSIEKVNALLDVPFLNSSNVMWFNEINQQTATSGSRVLLKGSLGNLTLSYKGSNIFYYLLKSGQFLKYIKEALAWKKSGTKPIKILSLSFLPFIPGRLHFFLKTLFKSNDNLIESYSLINPDFLKRQAVKYKKFNRHLASDLRINSIIKSDLSAYYLYANSMGIEMRDPTADLRLIKFCLSIPEDQFCRKKNSRWLAKRLLARTLPESIDLTKSRGLQQVDFVEHLSRSLPKVYILIDKLKKNTAVKASLALDVLENNCKLHEDEIIKKNGDSIKNIVTSFKISRAISIGAFMTQYFVK